MNRRSVLRALGLGAPAAALVAASSAFAHGGLEAVMPVRVDNALAPGEIDFSEIHAALNEQTQWIGANVRRIIDEAETLANPEQIRYR